jgi:hypothetical protein
MMIKDRKQINLKSSVPRFANTIPSADFAGDCYSSSK